MAVPPELLWLIQRLSSTPSKRERLRLLVEGRRTLRALGPADRLAVARELGIEGAERVVEEIAERGGFSPEPLRGVLEEVEEDGGQEAVSAVRGLFDPATRNASVARLLDAASGWVADLDAYRSEADSTGEDVESAHESAPAGDQQPEAEVVVEEEDAATAAGEPELSVEAVETDSEPSVAEGPERELAPQPVAPPAPEGESDGGMEPGPVDVAVSHSVVSVGEAQETEPSSVAVDRLLARIGAEARSQDRLAALRAGLDDLRGADEEPLARILTVFPEGWVRRRALETLFRGGCPDSLEVALRLVNLLKRRSERMWVLTTLAATRRMSPLEADALIAAADSPAVARRLSHRLART